MTTKTQVPTLYKASKRFLFRMAPRGTAYSTQQLFERKEILTSIYAQSNGFKKGPKKATVFLGKHERKGVLFEIFEM